MPPSPELTKAERIVSIAATSMMTLPGVIVGLKAESVTTTLTLGFVGACAGFLTCRAVISMNQQPNEN